MSDLRHMSDLIRDHLYFVDVKSTDIEVYEHGPCTLRLVRRNGCNIVVELHRAELISLAERILVATGDDQEGHHEK